MSPNVLLCRACVGDPDGIATNGTAAAHGARCCACGTTDGVKAWPLGATAGASAAAAEIERLKAENAELKSAAEVESTRHLMIDTVHTTIRAKQVARIDALRLAMKEAERHLPMSAAWSGNLLRQALFDDEALAADTAIPVVAESATADAGWSGDCPDCKGCGMQSDCADPCDDCNGTGRIPADKAGAR